MHEKLDRSKLTVILRPHDLETKKFLMALNVYFRFEVR